MNRYEKQNGKQGYKDMGNGQIIKDAHAKINLGLDVLRKREDGYHEVKMIMQTIGLHDTLTFSRTEDEGIVIESDSGRLPLDEHNLIYKAAKIFFEEVGQAFGVHVFLEKRIPIAAGMAGGSTDAAAAFEALNELAGCPFSQEKLMKIAVRVGADVPYCILKGTALSEGIGEILTALPPVAPANLVIAKPDIDVSTAFVYKNLRVNELDNHPDIVGMRAAIEKNDLQGVTKRLGNVLETVTIPAHPIIGKIKACCMTNGAVNALMSGSGPTVFAIFDSPVKAGQAAEKIRSEFQLDEVYVTEFWGQ